MTHWFHVRAARTQGIQLIERVNRQQNAPAGFKLFRDTLEGAREVTNVRTLQMTLLNSSNRLLRNSEIQFEFDSKDVESWVSRPVKSRTALVAITSQPIDPWQRSLRWKIPHFPPGDSIEFSFQVIDPGTETYEASLDSNENVVLVRSSGEPPVPLRGDRVLLILGIGMGLSLLSSSAVYTYTIGKDAREEATERLRDEIRVIKNLVCTDEIIGKNDALRKWCVSPIDLLDVPPIEPPGGP